jgi:alkyl hydroperoxide reductase subunit AhpF
MDLTLIISDNCETCERVKNILNEKFSNNSSINLTTIHKEEFAGKTISITPALLIDGKLFSYGDIDTDKLVTKLNGD